MGDALGIAHFVLKRVGQGGALGGAILLNLKAQVGQVGHFVRRVCIREIPHLKSLVGREGYG